MDATRGLEEDRQDAEITPAGMSLTALLTTRELSTQSHLKNMSGQGDREDCLSFPGLLLPTQGTGEWFLAAVSTA